ncbi:MAG: 2-amino-4-hydroxy-6-hydroxymethyldihydropteridine diphosphokinase [Planctomycetes bacterium]|nr:2-amino-4-hydroxy-6-hydroxymethyldihydropteridine diphosphokinase [Planctomycetota bacterium]MBL7107522.1 2-amino-4-hydroxy-6-hydroxymethyldihydropteridine diphosphokinase [Phycisphaerae bacterium]
MARRKVYLGLGSNLGDRHANIQKAIQMLAKLKGEENLRLSSITETAPLADMSQPMYLNAVAELTTGINCDTLLTACKKIEKILGRDDGKKWSPRPIDIDILLAGDEIINTENLTVPHSQMHLRSFVLSAILELDKSLIHPALAQPIETLSKRLNGSDFFLDPNVPQLVSIAGLIGVGKTTLAEGLSAVTGGTRIHEPYKQNPFLAKVYNGDKELALDSQLFFLTQRIKQLTGSHIKNGQLYLCDYISNKELIYAKQTLNDSQLALYMDIYKAFEDKPTQPILVIYMNDSPDRCLDRIHKRGRTYEHDISTDFLSSLQAGYNDLFENWNKCPVIRLDCSDFDCTNNSHLKKLTDQIKAYTAFRD